MIVESFDAIITISSHSLFIHLVTLLHVYHLVRVEAIK
jgi:hypothetical protein